MLTLVSSHSLPVYMKNDEYLGTSYLVMYFGNAGFIESKTEWHRRINPQILGCKF